MHASTRSTLALLLASTLPLTTGCAGWRSQIDSNAARYDTLTIEKPATPKKLLLTMTVTHPGVDQAAQERQTATYTKRADEFFAKSGLFAEAGTAIPDPDYELVLNVQEQEDFPMALAVLCGLTLLVIPAYDRVTTTAVGEVFDASGEKLGAVAVDQQFDALISLLLLPAIPTFFVTVNRSQEDLFKSITAQLIDIEEMWR